MGLMASYAGHQCTSDATCLFSFRCCKPQILQYKLLYRTVSKLEHIPDEAKMWYSCLSPSPSWVMDSSWTPPRVQCWHPHAFSSITHLKSNLLYTLKPKSYLDHNVDQAFWGYIKLASLRFILHFTLNFFWLTSSSETVGYPSSFSTSRIYSLEGLLILLIRKKVTGSPISLIHKQDSSVFILFHTKNCNYLKLNIKEKPSKIFSFKQKTQNTYDVWFIFLSFLNLLPVLRTSYLRKDF